MSTLKIGEAGTVQFPMVNYAAEIGWTAISDKVALGMRGDFAATLLRGVLEAKHTEFNPWLTADGVRSIIERLDALRRMLKEIARCMPECAARVSGTTKLKNVTGRWC